VYRELTPLCPVKDLEGEMWIFRMRRQGDRGRATKGRRWKMAMIAILEGPVVWGASGLWDPKEGGKCERAELKRSSFFEKSRGKLAETALRAGVEKQKPNKARDVSTRPRKSTWGDIIRNSKGTKENCNVLWEHRFPGTAVAVLKTCDRKNGGSGLSSKGGDRSVLVRAADDLSAEHRVKKVLEREHWEGF